MSTVVWLKNIRIEVRSREQNHTRKPHCHAVMGTGRGKRDASISLDTFEVLASRGYAESDVKQIIATVQENLDELKAEWERCHGKK